jgi:L-alanine-DL-glutamate epimerase-like enolase superfamily enzyme
VSLDTDFERLSLDLDEPFTIARGTQETVENIVVRIADGEHEGIGAAAPSAHYGETPRTVEAVLSDLLAVVEEVGDPHAIARIERLMREAVRDNPAARAAVSIALHDLAAKRLDVPLYRYWGLDPATAPATSFTIGLDSIERMREKTESAVDAGHTVLKVKLGTGRDREIIAAIRSVAPDVRLRVDANEAWTPHEAVSNIDALADFDVEFVEQPVPAENPAGLEYVHERSPLPIAADESCVTLADIPPVAERADIANIKLMKCGGLGEARRMVHAARAQGLAVMCGCMVASNAAIAAACHLAPLLDYADLDGSLLLAEDPFRGVPIRAGDIDLENTARAGTGAQALE